MVFDAHANFGASTVATAPVPALTGLSLTVAGGQGALFPAAPFNCTVWPASVAPTASNAEIIRVTVVVGDVFTILRGQEGTAAVPIAAGYQIANTSTRLVFTDIENSIIQEIVAGGATATASQVSFANSPTVTFGIAGQTVTASVAGAAQTTQPVAASAANGSFLFSTLSFSDTNGISFSTSAGGAIFASHNGITSQSNPAFSASGGSSTFQTLSFRNANGATFSNSNGSVELSYTVPTFTQSTQPVAASASNGSFLFSTVAFSNANNVTFGTSAGSIITASVAATVPQSTQPVAASASNGSFLFSTVAFSNANNVTFGTSAGSIITASVASTTPQSTQPVAASASNGSFAFSTLGFSNANNVTFGTSAGSIVTASVASTTPQSTQPVAASASNGSFLFSTLGFSNANGVTFGTSAGSIVSASVAARALLSMYNRPDMLITTVALLNSASASFFQLYLPSDLTVTRADFMISQALGQANNNSTGGINYGHTFVLLTRDNQTLRSVFSTAGTSGITWTSDGQTSLSGGVMYPVPMATSLTAGRYWVGYLMSTNATGGTITGAATTSLTATVSMCVVGNTNAVTFKELGSASASSVAFYSAQGVNTSIGNLTEVSISNISGASTFNQRADLMMRFVA